MNTDRNISVVRLALIGAVNIQLISQKLSAENAKLKIQINQIGMADFADFIERRSLEDDTTGSN